MARNFKVKDFAFQTILDKPEFAELSFKVFYNNFMDALKSNSISRFEVYGVQYLVNKKMSAVEEFMMRKNKDFMLDYRANTINMFDRDFYQTHLNISTYVNRYVNFMDVGYKTDHVYGGSSTEAILSNPPRSFNIDSKMTNLFNDVFATNRKHIWTPVTLTELSQMTSVENDKSIVVIFAEYIRKAKELWNVFLNAIKNGSISQIEVYGVYYCFEQVWNWIQYISLNETMKVPDDYTNKYNDQIRPVYKWMAEYIKFIDGEIDKMILVRPEAFDLFTD